MSPSSTNRLTHATPATKAEPLRGDQAGTVGKRLLGAVIRLGAPALEMAVLNRVESADFSEPSHGELFEVARRARLADEPMTLVTLKEPIAAEGLQEVAGAVLKASSNVPLAEVPILSRRLVREAVYRDGMRAASDLHAKATAMMVSSGHPRDLLHVFEQHAWTMKRLERRLKDLF